MIDGASKAEDTARAMTSELTRALCGAAYLDGKFATKALEGLLCGPLHPVVPVPGVHLTLVLRHCLTALRYHRVQWAVLSVVLMATITTLIFVPPYAPLGYVVAAVATVRYRIAMKKVVFKRLRPDRFREDLGAPRMPRRWMTGCVESIERAEAGNVTVFSGYEPFRGYGRYLGGWSFALPLIAKKNPITGADAEPVRPFSAADLFGYVRDELIQAADKSGSRALPAGLFVHERVFAEGDAVGTDGTLLRDPSGQPTTGLDPDRITAIVNQPCESLRCYLAAHLPSGQNLMAVSSFFRFFTDDDMLYVESETTAHPPL